MSNEGQWAKNLSSAGERASAVNWISSAGNPRCLIRCKKQHKLGYFFRAADSSERMCTFGMFEKFCVLIFVHSTGSMQAGHDHTRVHCIYAYAFWRQLK